MPHDFRNSKIIFFTHYTGLYGANRSLLDLISGLYKLGFIDILLIAPKQGEILKEARRKNIACRSIRFVNEMHSTSLKESFLKKRIKHIFNWVAVFVYSISLKANKKIIIHSNSSVTLIGAYFSYWLKASHVWHIREFGKEDYNLEYNYGYNYFQTWLNKSAAVIAISNSVFNQRVADSKVAIKSVIYNGVIFTDELVQKRKTFIKKTSPAFTFGSIGFISKEKNQLEAIEALNLLNKEKKDNQLIIAGTYEDQDYMDLLAEKINEYNLSDKVSFKGFIKNSENFYRTIDCLLMCSKHEALGRVTLEAMSYGIPVIGFDNDGTSEIIQHKINGLLYKKQYHDLHEQMQLLMNDEALFNYIRLNAVKTVQENFTIDKYAESVSDIYAKC